MRINLATCIVAIFVALFGCAAVGVNAYFYLTPDKHETETAKNVHTATVPE